MKQLENINDKLQLYFESTPTIKLSSRCRAVISVEQEYSLRWGTIEADTNPQVNSPQQPELHR
jgi:hypothetical protein